MALYGSILYQVHFDTTDLVELPTPDWDIYQEQMVLTISITNISNISSDFILHCSKNAGIFDNSSIIIPNAGIPRISQLSIFGRFPIRNGQQWAAQAGNVNTITLTMWGMNRTR